MFKSFFKKDENSISDIAPLLIELVAEIKEIKKEEISVNTLFSEIGFDSVNYINLLLRLQDVIGLDIEQIVLNIDLSSILSIKDLLEVLIKLKTE